MTGNDSGILSCFMRNNKIVQNDQIENHVKSEEIREMENLLTIRN